MCNSIYEASLISGLFRNAKRTVEFIPFFFFFVIFAAGVTQLLQLLATTCFQALHLKLLVVTEDKHERPQ